MTCDVSSSVLHAYLDGELDAVRAAEFEQHLEGCATCVRDLEAQESLRSSIQRAQLYEAFPAKLESKVRRQLNEATASRVSNRIAAWRGLAAAAVLLLAIGVSWRVLPRLRGEPALSASAAEIVDAHIRSLQPGHLTDVTSTDQHTVKPWFAGRTAFAPPVRDFAAQDFPLVGGRLDVFQGHTVAALVYGRRKHFISVFIWPDATQNAEQYAGAMNGYQWISWKQSGLRFCAVADTSRDDLAALKDLISR